MFPARAGHSGRACRECGLTGVLRMHPRLSFLAQAPLLAAVVAASPGLVQCDRREVPAAATLGEPIGVRVDDVKDASGKKLGSLAGAFAVTKGQAAEPLVASMARVLDRVGKNCPSLFATKGEGAIHVIGKASKGVLDFGPGSSGENAEQRCFREAMQGQRISETPIDTAIAVELRPEMSP